MEDQDLLPENNKNNFKCKIECNKDENVQIKEEILEGKSSCIFSKYLYFS